MKRIKVFLLTASLLLAAVPSFALTPKAGIRGPTSAVATLPGQPEHLIALRFPGCVADTPEQLQLTYEAPDGAKPITPTYLFDSQGRMAFAEFAVQTPGAYVFTVVAEGIPDGAKTSKYATASLFVNVTSPAPGPEPGPEPTPGPPPGPGPTPPPVPVPPAPAPTPAPVPISTKLFAIAVYSGDTTSKDELTFAAVRDDPTLKATLASMSVDWRAWDYGNPKLDELSIKPYIATFGKTPCLIIYDGTGKIYNAAGQPARSAIAAPLTSADMVKLFKGLRGVN